MKKYDWKIFGVGAVVASLALAACGASASLDSGISSLSGSQYLQVHISATYSGAQAAQVTPILSQLSYNLSEASTTGQSLSQSVGNIDTEVDVNVGSQTLVTLRGIGRDLYFEVNLQALSSFPSLGLSTQKLAALELLFDNRWFDVPESLLTSLEPASTITKAQTSKEQALAQKLIKAVTAVIEGNTYTTLPDGGYSQTGTLASFVDAVLPTLEQIEGHSIPHPKVPGTYTIGVTMSGSNATGGSISVTAPDGTSGNATIGLSATVAHATVAIATPSGATVVTKSLIEELEGQATSAASGSVSASAT
jgi:hypothetical protein